MPMTKREIIDLLHEKGGLTRKECTSIVESTIDIIKGELGKGNSVKIVGFGKWTLNSKKERAGRNPQTGEALSIKARRVVTFKTSPILKNALNKED